MPPLIPCASSLGASSKPKLLIVSVALLPLILGSSIAIIFRLNLWIIYSRCPNVHAFPMPQRFQYNIDVINRKEWCCISNQIMVPISRLPSIRGKSLHVVSKEGSVLSVNLSPYSGSTGRTFHFHCGGNILLWGKKSLEWLLHINIWRVRWFESLNLITLGQ